MPDTFIPCYKRKHIRVIVNVTGESLSLVVLAQNNGSICFAANDFITNLDSRIIFCHCQAVQAAAVWPCLLTRYTTKQHITRKVEGGRTCNLLAKQHQTVDKPATVIRVVHSGLRRGGICCITPTSNDD